MIIEINSRVGITCDILDRCRYHGQHPDRVDIASLTFRIISRRFSSLFFLSFFSPLGSVSLRSTAARSLRPERVFSRILLYPYDLPPPRPSYRIGYFASDVRLPRILVKIITDGWRGLPIASRIVRRSRFGGGRSRPGRFPTYATLPTGDRGNLKPDGRVGTAVRASEGPATRPFEPSIGFVLDRRRRPPRGCGVPARSLSRATPFYL